VLKTASAKKSNGQPPPHKESKGSGTPQPAANPLWQLLSVSSTGLQAKLTVSQSGDPHEQEADRIADQVMRMPAPGGADSKPTNRAALSVQTKAKSLEDEEQTVHRDTDGPQRRAAFTAPAEVHNTLQSPGSPLAPATRSFFEPRFGYDLSNVRVHTDALAGESAQAIRANAYTAQDHIAFRAGQYSPETDAGRALLAHELTHVLQQGAATPKEKTHAPSPNGSSAANGNGSSAANGNGKAPSVAQTASPQVAREVRTEAEPATPIVQPSWSLPLSTITPRIQRAPGDPQKVAKPVDSIVTGDVTVRVFPEQGLMSFTLVDEPWITVRWEPGSARFPNVKITSTSLSDKIEVEVSAPYDLRVTVNHGTEESYAARMLAGTSFFHKYTAGGGNVLVNEHLPGSALVPAVYTEKNHYDGHDLRIDFNPEVMEAPPAPPINEPPPFWWEFDRVEQLDAFALAHPKYYWVATQPAAGGRMRAINLTEKDLQTALVRFREDPEIAASIFRFYENGIAWTDLDPLYYMFFAYPVAAKIGAPGDAPECLIFTHGKGSYGRYALTHEEALSVWTQLEELDTAEGADAVAAVNVEGLGQFYSLMVAGKTAVWELDVDYFRKRDLFLANVLMRKQGGGADWSDLFHEDLAIWEHYLRYALDRDEALIDPELAAIIDTDSDFVSAAGERVYERVEESARLTALSAVGAAIRGIEVYTDEDNLRALVLQFPFMSTKERFDALTFLGTSPFLVPVVEFVLRNSESAQLVAMGESAYGITLSVLMVGIEGHHKELQNTYSQLADANALLLEGEFGDEVRKVTYERYGFGLDPHLYPHESVEDARAWTGRQTTQGLSFFGTEAGYLYASEAAARARHERHMKYLKIALVVAASVALVIVSAGAGVAVAGLVVGTEATGVAAAVGFTIEVAVSSMIVTAVGPGLSTFIMTEGSLDPEAYKEAYSHWGRDFLVNFVTFGFFKGLSIAIEAGAMAAAGGKEAFEASAAWQRGAIAARVITSGSAMFGISMLSHRLESGKWPEGESLHEVLFETGLSIVLLEMGSFMARGSMQKIQSWARTKRIGAGVVAEMNAIRVEVTALNEAAAKFNADPIGKKSTGMDLLAKQEALLKRQAEVIKGLKDSFGKAADAEAFNKLIAKELAEINARLNEIRGVVAFGKAEVRPMAAGGSGDVAEFTYKRGTEQELKDYFGKENVTDVGGVLEVMVGGATGKKLIFRPATNTAAGIMPSGAHTPDALIAWRNTAVTRIRGILERAGKLAADKPVLREVAKADPSTMDLAKMRDFEKLLDRAEKLLTNLEKGGPLSQISITKDGASTEDWRLRLVAERDRLLSRASLVGKENDPLVTDMSKLPMKRAGLKENTLENYRQIIDKARTMIDKAQAARLTALNQAAGGGPAPIADLQTRLSDRRADVLRRAKLFKTAKSRYILDVKSLAIGGAKKYSTLSGSEEIIARAEAKLDALAKKALDDAVTLHGPDVVTNVRAGPGLEKLTDAQVGDVMRMLGSANKLPAEALRGALLAAYAADATTPISIKRLVALSRSPAELEFVLTTFGMLRDAQVGGSFRMLRDGVSSGDKWVGAVWEMKLARMVIGIDKIRSFEVPKTTATGNRVIDILLLDGRTVEAKDWANWLPDKVQEQFFRDLEINTVDGTVASGMEKIRWIFSDPPPVSVADIRATMKTALEDFIVKKGLTKDKADALRDAFDAHSSLVESPKLGLPAAKPGVETPPKKTEVPPPPPRKDDEE
jgi:hypothetical protein